jgi:hypothetical protein
VASDGASTPSALGGFAKIGEYFQLISVVPGSIVVLIPTFLVAGGAPGRRPVLAKALAVAAKSGFAGPLIFALAVIVVGMTLHPLQFATVQFFEGYWGQRPFARAAMFSRARRHLARRQSWTSAAIESSEALNLCWQDHDDGDRDDLQLVGIRDNLLRLEIDAQEYGTAADRYPDWHRVMPTRLGNTLRRYEDRCGEPYGFGINGPAIVPYLLSMTGDSATESVDDARGDLDLAIRLTISWLIAALTSFVLLLGGGPWLVVPLVCYALAWLSYIGAVKAAEDYGQSLWILIDMHRRLLPGKLRVSPSGGGLLLSSAEEMERLVRRKRSDE